MNFTARQKLNWISLYTILTIAAVLGLILQSWPAFLLTAGILFFLALGKQDIRLRDERNW